MTCDSKTIGNHTEKIANKNETEYCKKNGKKVGAFFFYIFNKDGIKEELKKKFNGRLPETRKKH